jgi:hypothetical protein
MHVGTNFSTSLFDICKISCCCLVVNRKLEYLHSVHNSCLLHIGMKSLLGDIRHVILFISSNFLFYRNDPSYLDVEDSLIGYMN